MDSSEEEPTSPSEDSTLEALPEELAKAGGQSLDPHATLPDTTGKKSEVIMPTSIGPYRILRIVGQGGMGTVFLAEQEVPIRRQVALKLIKLGQGSSEVILRFEAERQALAMMDHLNIAKILDAGKAEDGSPYFAMEYVEGIPLTQYCDQHKLSIQERLELLIPICNAIQHAHQKGIIHRDLKPSNILVAEADGKPVAKVIDFGLAKALDHQNQISSETLSLHGMVMGTLQYMSPEQAELDPNDIDTRTDIFALGIILYELLTGSPPITEETLCKNTMLHLLEIIREQEPVKPSQKLSSLAIRVEELASVSDSRRLEPKRISSILRGDLDWIVMKSIEKDRERRYETANSFSRDIQRFLADEPIEARPPSFIYRLQKSFQRNRVKFLTAATFLGMLLVALPVISWQAIRNANLVVERENEITDQRLTSEFLLDVFGAGDPIFSKLVSRFGSEFGREPTVRQVVIGALRLEIDDSNTRLAARPQLRGKLLAMLADLAISTGEVQLGRKALNKCEELTKGTKFSEGQEYFKAQVSQAILDYMYGDMRRAKERLLAAQEVLLPLSKQNPSDVALERKAADTHLILGIVQIELYEHDGAIESFRSMAEFSQADGPVNRIRKIAGEVFAATTEVDKRRLAGQAFDTGLLDDFTGFMEVVEKEELINDTIMVAVKNALSAQLFLASGFSSLALGPQQAMLKNMRAGLGDDHILNCFPLFYASNIAAKADRPADALGYIDELLELLDKNLSGCQHPRLCQVYRHRAGLLVDLAESEETEGVKRLEEAESSCDRALEIGLNSKDTALWHIADAFLLRSEIRQELGDQAGAEEDIEEVRLRFGTANATSYMLLNARRDLARALMTIDRLADAESEIRSVIESRTKAKNRRDQLGRDRLTLVDILMRQKLDADPQGRNDILKLVGEAISDLESNATKWPNSLRHAKKLVKDLQSQ